MRWYPLLDHLISTLALLYQGLRMLLHQLQSTAARYEKYIEPLLSLSIDFYIRVFVRVRNSANERKKAASKTGLLFYCPRCKSIKTSALGMHLFF